VAFAAFHLVRSSARERLGLSCGLRGNGMAFSRALLRDVPHAAFSKTEDLEFGVHLGLRGVRVAFAGGARVYGDMPERPAVVDTQRERWIGGRVAMARRFAPALVRQALRGRSLMAADLACDLIVPPLSVLLLASIAGLAISLLLAMAAGATTWAWAVWLLACAGLGVHVAHAARVAGRGRAFIRAAGSVPGYAVGKALTAVRALRRSDDAWVRTARHGENQ
jgi:1,2-diacylglycerol 3-beta-glucosyltransferase